MYMSDEDKFCEANSSPGVQGAYRADETDVPAAAKTRDISDFVKERKDWTTVGSN